MNTLTQKYIAHRGLFNNIDIPENTIASALNAVNNDFGIEFDVQSTKDNVLVVFHDDDLYRMTGKKGLVCDYNWEEIKELPLLNTTHTIPTLRQWLDAVDGKSYLVVEIKSHKNIGAMEQAVLDMLNTYQGEYCVESFNPFIVRWFAVHAPHIMRGQLSESFDKAPLSQFKKWLLSNLMLLKYAKAQFIAYNINDLPHKSKIQRLRKKIPVIVWTAKSQQQHDDNRHLYDNMIFDSFVPLRDDLNK